MWIAGRGCAKASERSQADASGKQDFCLIAFALP
jgi:hypothetical protein